MHLFHKVIRDHRVTLRWGQRNGGSLVIPKYSNIMPQAVVAKTFGAIVAGDKTYLLHQACYQGQSRD